MKEIIPPPITGTARTKAILKDLRARQKLVKKYSLKVIAQKYGVTPGWVDQLNKKLSTGK